MSFLNAMKEKKKEMLIAKHPICSEDLLLREVYATGVAVLMAKEDDLLNDAEMEHLKELTFALLLTDDPVERISTLAEEATVDIFDDIVRVLSTIDLKYMFILDLYKAARIDNDELKQEEQEMIDHFADMLKLKSIEVEFLKGIARAMQAKDLSAVNSMVQKAIEQSLEVNVRHLEYFMPEFQYVEEIEGFTVDSHETRIIQRSGVIKGSITINAGGKLIVRDVVLTLNDTSQILVEGGVLELANTTLKAASIAGGPLIVISSNTPFFEADNCVFDGGKKVQMLATLAGKTSLTNCTFTNGFINGEPVELIDNHAVSMRLGAAIYANSLLILKNCTFLENIAETAAGAVFAGGQLQISDCIFINCQSRGIGGALVACNKYSISDTKFERCSSLCDGGACYLVGGNETSSNLQNGTFLKCSSAKNGGGLFIQEVKYNIRNCTFSDCSAGLNGGGVATYKYDQQPSYLINSRFNNCTAESGGAIIISSNNGHVYRPDINGNIYSECTSEDIMYVCRSN